MQAEQATDNLATIEELLNVDNKTEAALFTIGWIRSTMDRRPGVIPSNTTMHLETAMRILQEFADERSSSKPQS